MIKNGIRVDDKAPAGSFAVRRNLQARNYPYVYLDGIYLAIFDAVKGHKLELGVILGAFYGLRRSEVVGLR